IVGVKLEIKWRVASDEWREKKKQDAVNAQVVLLAENAEGYSNLCRLVTLRQMGTVAPRPKTEDVENEGRPVILEELAQYSKGIIALTSLRKSESSNEIGALKELFDDRLYLAVQRLSPGDGRLVREAERIGKELNIPLVATNNVHFLK